MDYKEIKVELLNDAMEIVNDRDKMANTAFKPQGLDQIGEIRSEQIKEIFPFVCGLCFQKFNKVVPYFTHLRKHKEINMESLEICNESIRNDDRDESGKPYQCEICESKFITICNLHFHMIHEENLDKFVYYNGYKMAGEHLINNIFDGDFKSSKLKTVIRSPHSSNGAEVSVDLAEESVCGADELVENLSEDDANVKQNCNGVESTQTGNHQIENREVTSISNTDQNLASDVVSLKIVKQELERVLENGSGSGGEDTDDYYKDYKERRNKKVKKQHRGSQNGRKRKRSEKKRTRKKANKESLIESKDDVIEEDNADELKDKDTGEDNEIKSVDSEENEVNTKPKITKGGVTAAIDEHGNKLYAKHMRVPCHICGAMYKRQNIKNHMISHQEMRNFQCDVCLKWYKTKGQLSLHKEHHTVERNFICKHCGKCFNTKGNLRQHERTHTAERRHVCSVCPAKFTTKFILQKHLLVHSDVRPFTCKICFMGFKRSDGLLKHQVMHRDERPFPCSLCGKGFKTRKDVLKHERIHKPPAYFCRFCGKSTITKANMKIHEKIHTRDKVKRDDHLPEQVNDPLADNGIVDWSKLKEAADYGFN